MLAGRMRMGDECVGRAIALGRLRCGEERFAHFIAHFKRVRTDRRPQISVQIGGLALRERCDALRRLLDNAGREAAQSRVSRSDRPAFPVGMLFNILNLLLIGILVLRRAHPRLDPLNVLPTPAAVP